MASTKNVLRQYQAVTNGDMSGNITSAVTNVQFLDDLVIQLNFTGTPSGTFAVQGSVDYYQDSQGNVISPGNWIDIPVAPIPTASGAADQCLIELPLMSIPWIRVVYTRTGGTGTLNMFIAAKEI